ncbi:MAG TPA: DUF1801 domain-containing protein [Saprospiraceae bacterium]|nr:DUF1801 domain-containing protein [Saprospiraceae bacterium]HPN72214.1 DUF1801 domain-containing protein [Saprospiraceae bacterium]
MNPKVDFFFDKAKAWQKEYELLRKIVLKTELEEELKWGCPCYTFEGSNIVLIHGFKEYCALLFHKGVLLNDEAGLLIQQTENVQSARQMRFTNIETIEALASTIESYIYEAIEVEKAGLKVELKKPSEFKMAVEFQQALDKNEKLKNAFEALTPGRQRAYLLHFSQPKLSTTRESRVKNSIEDIMNGKGLND